MEEKHIAEPTFSSRVLNSLIVQSINDSVFILDTEYRYLYINKALEKTAEIRAEDFLGNSIFEMVPYLAGSPLEEYCKQAFATQERMTLEQYYPQFDAWTEYTIHPNPDCLVIFCKITSDHKKKEEESLKQIKRNALILDSMRESFLLADENLDIVDMNQAMCDMLGYRREEMLQMNICDFDTQTSKETILKNIQDVVEKRIPYIDTRNRKKNGEIVDVELAIIELTIDAKRHFASFGRDVTEFKSAQRELKKANQRFEQIGIATQEALWEVEIATGVRWANEIHQNMYGLTMADPVPGSLPWQKRIDPAVRKDIINSLETAIKNQETTWTTEYTFLTANKGWVNIYDRTHLIYDEKGNPVRMLGSMTNVSEVKKAEVAIRTEKEISESIVNILPGIFFLANKEGTILRWNKNFEKFSGYTPEEISSMHAFDFFDSEEQEAQLAKISEVMDEGEAEVEINLHAKNGAKIPLYLNGRMIKKHGVEYFVIVGIDMTEIKKAEGAMQVMKEEISNQKVLQQKKISRAIIKTQETERNYIGAELHDNVNQLLAGARLYMSIAGKKGAEIKEAISYPTELIEDAINEIRKLTAKYVSPLKDVDLKQLTETLLRNIEQSTEIETKISYDVSATIPPDLKINIYRILQELVNNILKHASCTTLSISIFSRDESLVIQVTDDGVGFDTKQKKDGIGLSNIANRVDSFEGEMSVQSEPGGGCVVSIIFPV